MYCLGRSSPKSRRTSGRSRRPSPPARTIAQLCMGRTVCGRLWEARAGVIVAVVAGFGRIIAEVGAVMLVGGNIQGATRVLTTAIVLETRTGAFDLALALAFVLLAISFLINTLLVRLQGRVSVYGV